jgi:hypothetical protein
VRPATELASTIGGFVTGEGCFLASGSPRSFTFSVKLGARDAELIDALREYFGVGTMHAYARRKEHYDDEVVFQVRKTRDLVEVIVPFMDEHLPPSHKREQYFVWRGQLVEHWTDHARRRRPCTVEGCDQPQRAKKLCRHHYYQAHGR